MEEPRRNDRTTTKIPFPRPRWITPGGRTQLPSEPGTRRAPTRDPAPGTDGNHAPFDWPAPRDIGPRDPRGNP